jgi:sugar/nucleoside kinase (ribokinase family)
MDQSSVICIGSTSQDIFLPTDEGIIIKTPEDVTAQEKIAFEIGGKYRVPDRYEALGGVAANVAQGLVKQGYGAACYTKVGDDDLGRWARQEYERAGVDTGTLFVEQGIKTDLSAIIVLTKNGERTIFHNRDANERLEIIEEKLLPASWFFVSALNGPWEKNLEMILALARKGKVKLALNPGQHNIKENAGLVRQAIAQTDILVINKDEALELSLREKSEGGLSAEKDERALLEYLLGLGAQTIGLTDGKRGAWASDGSEFWHCPSPAPERLVDSTGAGDAFSSGFVGGLLAERDLETALRQGVANSISVLGFYGAAAGLLNAENLKQKSAALRAEVLS